VPDQAWLLTGAIVPYSRSGAIVPILVTEDRSCPVHHAKSPSRELFEIEEVQATVRETDDPEVVVTEITHHGWSRVTESPYRLTAIGVIRVRGGEIVRYDDYMDPIAAARLLGRAGDLAAALADPAA
jgi:uncharacterized protein